MKKYKLIKEYPGSDHEGIIVSLKTPNGLYEGYQYNYYSKHVENQPEYWEEVVEKDYQILRYYSIENPSIGRTTCNSKLNDTYNIYSVKRLSDGEVFTIGDLITGYSYEDARSIQTIKICRYTGIIKLEQEKGFTSLCTATKVKQPIFLTHNGKDIFAGDKVWYVNKENFYYDYILAFPEVKFNSEIRAYFLTRLEAEEYVEKNKPLFTTEDGVDIRKGDKYYFVDTDFSVSLAPNASAGCGQYSERKYFATLAAAENCAIQHSRVLSIEDFWEFVCWGGSNIAKSKRLKRLVKERLNLK